MHVIGVIGPSDSGKTTLVERLVERLSDRGTVGTVKRMTHAPDLDTEGKDTERHRRSGSHETYGITDDEGWFATGDALSLVDALERLAPAHEYAVVEGYSHATIPRVALDGRPMTENDHDPWDRIVASGDGADDVDVAELIGTIERLPSFETLASLRRRTPAGATARRPVVGVRSSVDAPVAEETIAAIERGISDVEGVENALAHVQPAVLESGSDVVLVVCTVPGRDALSDVVAALADRIGGVESIDVFDGVASDGPTESELSTTPP